MYSALIVDNEFVLATQLGTHQRKESQKNVIWIFQHKIFQGQICYIH